MNSTILIGNLTYDIELKKTQSNKSVCDFSIAINNGKDRNGNEREATFINCQAWESTAEILSKFTSKGSKIAVNGHLDVQRWQDNYGNNRSKMIVVADRIELLSPRQGGNQPRDNQPSQAQTGEYEPLKGHEEPMQTGTLKPSDIAPDDLPFY